MAKCDDRADKARKRKEKLKVLKIHVSSSAYASLEVSLRYVYSKSAIWIVIISFITKDLTQKWSQISLHTDVVTGTNY